MAYLACDLGGTLAPARCGGTLANSVKGRPQCVMPSSGSRVLDAWSCDGIDRAPPYGRLATRASTLFAALSEVKCRTASEPDTSLFEPQARPFRADRQRSSRICLTTACGVNCVMTGSLSRRRMLVAATASAEPV